MSTPTLEISRALQAASALDRGQVAQLLADFRRMSIARMSIVRRQFAGAELPTDLADFESFSSRMDAIEESVLRPQMGLPATRRGPSTSPHPSGLNRAQRRKK